MAQLSTGPSSPREQISIGLNGDCVSFAACHLPDLMLLQDHDKFRLWLIWASIFILGHCTCVRMSQLPTAAPSPGIEPAFGS